MKRNYFKMLVLILISVTGIRNESFAIECVPTPDCAALGYTKTTSECSGANLVLKCPFDDSKVACSAVTYEPKVGYILYSDKTFSPNVEAGKKPIGVVFDEANRLAVALDQTRLYWSTERIDIPTLENCDRDEKYSCSTNGKQNTAAIMEYVKTNGKTGKYPAAEYCASYKPSTVYQDEAWYGEGQWFLPSMKELKTLFSNVFPKFWRFFCSFTNNEYFK